MAGMKSSDLSRDLSSGITWWSWRLVMGTVGIVIVLCFSCRLSTPARLAAETAQVNGVIYTVGSDYMQTVWPNARMILENLATGKLLSIVSHNLDQHSCSGVQPPRRTGDFSVLHHILRRKMKTMGNAES
jgi:hypothetical protein